MRYAVFSPGARCAISKIICCLALLQAVCAAGANPGRSAPAEQFEGEGDYLVNFWGRAQGLPHDTVNALLQTRDGYLWVGTSAGLARFDGLVFKTLEAETPGVAGATITSLLEDREGGLWIGTQGKGLLRLFGGKVQKFTGKEGLAGDSVTSLAEDVAGTVWVGTHSGLSRWKDGRLTRFATDAAPHGEVIVALHTGGSGALWITTRSGVFRFADGQATAFKSDQMPQGRNAEFIGAYEDLSGNLWAFGATFLLNVTQGQSLNSFPSFNLASSRVWTICEQSNGDFWIGTSGQGLFRFQNGRFEVVGARQGLEQCDIRALRADRWGNLWIGTEGNGLARLRTRRVKLVGASSGVDSRDLAAIAPDGGAGLWVATGDAGLLHWNGQRVETWSHGGPLARISQIQTLCLDTHTNLWVGTIGAGLIKVTGSRQVRLTTADGLGDDVITALAACPVTGSVWAGTQSGFLHRIRDGVIETFPPGEALTGSPILCLLPAAEGSLLIGSESGSVVQWNGSTLANLPVPDELKSRPVRCLFTDSKNRLWVGSWGAGVFCFSEDKWIQISRQEGLPADQVSVITQCPDGVFWFGTPENLYKARALELDRFMQGERDTVAFVPALAALDGLKSARGWPSTARSQNGALWLACSAELLPLTQTETPGFEPIPPVILERILVNGVARSVPQSGSLKLGPGTRSLDVEFTAISFTAPHRVRFRHKLENFDATWVQSDLARRAHYGPLPPGEYRFRVIAANAEGVWNEAGTSLDLVITPPLWRTWWFLSLCGAGLVSSIWGTARSISTRRLKTRLKAAEQRHAMERERARIARDMHDEIGSKLTRISFLSEVAQQTEGALASLPVQTIASTSRELLQSLDEIVWAVNPRNDNLEQLAGYLEQHAREYLQGTSCECHIHVPARLPAITLSAELRHNVFLAYEEALSNLLKHSQARVATIAMSLQPDAFEIRVKDDGVGFNISAEQPPGHDGLRNMRERLRAVGGSCELQSRVGIGTAVSLCFPLPARKKSGRLFFGFRDPEP